MTKIYNKLVRDRIPEIIASNGEIPIFYQLDDSEYWLSLLEKDAEELKEVKEAKNSQELKEKLADKLELIRAMAEYQESSLEEIIELANLKREERGGFEKRLFLENVVNK